VTPEKFSIELSEYRIRAIDYNCKLYESFFTAPDIAGKSKPTRRLWLFSSNYCQAEKSYINDLFLRLRIRLSPNSDSGSLHTSTCCVASKSAWFVEGIGI
jgi:hypothetical protein